MTVNHRKLKEITLSFGTDPDDIQAECQVTSWNVNNNTGDGDRVFTFCPDGEFVEDAEPEWTLRIAFAADWAGLSDYFYVHDGETVAFALEAHTDVAASPSAPHPKWVGSVKVKAPSAGGDARTTDSQEIEFPVIGIPTYSKVTA